MKKIKNILGTGALALMLMSCVTNPITGRKSVQLVSNAELSAMALQEYRAALSKSKVITNTTDAQRIKTVGTRIKNASENYYRSIGRLEDLQGYQWEFNLLQDAQKNAWCMPGGKVAFYTGLLPIAKDDTGIAVVLGHEVSHALAGHGNERISSAMLAQLGGSVAGMTIKNEQLSRVFQVAYPIGAQVGLMAYGRKQEIEADQMGLYIMGMAGYDPRQAKPFWDRMNANASSSNRPPEFLSTHPSPEKRRDNLDKFLPKALEYYKKAGGRI